MLKFKLKKIDMMTDAGVAADHFKGRESLLCKNLAAMMQEPKPLKWRG